MVGADRDIDEPGEPAGPVRFHMPPAQQLCAHHRRQRQRHDRRHHDRDRQRQRELAEHAADQPAHEQQRDEHRDQRDRQRDHGEPDLARALERGLERRLAVLDVANDVLDHHDGVVDDEAGADRESHQRQVVEAEAGKPHHAERGDQRQRQGDAGDDGRAQRAQEHQDHQHDQRHRQHQGELHVVHGGADGAGAIVHDGKLDAGRNRPLQARQLRQHPVDGLDDIGARLALDVDDHGGLAIVPAASFSTRDPDWRAGRRRARWPRPPSPRGGSAQRRRRTRRPGGSSKSARPARCAGSDRRPRDCPRPLACSPCL